MEMCSCGFLISAANDRMHTRGKWNWVAHLRALNTIVCQWLRSIHTEIHLQMYIKSSFFLLENIAWRVHGSSPWLSSKLTTHQLQCHFWLWDRKHYYCIASGALPRRTCVVRADIRGEQSLTIKHWFHPLGENHLPIMWYQSKDFLNYRN